MDYETKLIVEKLIDAIHQPDWWGFGATIFVGIVAAAITYVLGKRQNDLQEQQTKQQEYELYRRLYKLFFAIHNTAEGLIFKIYSHLAMGSMSPYTCSKMSDEIEQLQDELKDLIIDIKLKLPEETYRCDQYKFLITLMGGIINRIAVFEQRNQITNPNTLDMTKILNNTESNDNYLISLIDSFIVENELKEDFKNALIGLTISKTKFCEKDFLEKIKSHI